MITELVGLLMGLALGWTAGRRFEGAVKARADYTGQQAKVAGVRRAARRATRHAVGAVVVAAVVAVLALWLMGEAR